MDDIRRRAQLHNTQESQKKGTVCILCVVNLLDGAIYVFCTYNPTVHNITVCTSSNDLQHTTAGVQH
jgi:hypothetical protein